MTDGNVSDVFPFFDASAVELVDGVVTCVSTLPFCLASSIACRPVGVFGSTR